MDNGLQQILDSIVQHPQKYEGETDMSHSQNSMGYMVVLCIILYIVGVSIYLLVKFVRKKLDEARDRRFQREHQADMMAEAAREKPDEKAE